MNADEVIEAERTGRRLHYAETAGAPFLCGYGVRGDVETQWWPWVNCLDCWALRPHHATPHRLSVVSSPVVAVYPDRAGEDK